MLLREIAKIDSRAAARQKRKDDMILAKQMGEKIRSNRSGDSSEEEQDIQLKAEVQNEIEKLRKVAHVPDEIIQEK